MTARTPDLTRYGLVVFDLDGTLYRLGPVRRAMLGEILTTGGAPGRLARLRILRRFRHLREELSRRQPRGFEPALFAQLSKETGQDEQALRSLVVEWMEVRPLPFLAPARLPGAEAMFAALAAREVVTAVWSDYPVAEKLAALGLSAPHHVWAGDPEVAALKPDPAGLLLLMERIGARPEETLMIGDRLSHDGRAAEAAGTDFLLIAPRAPRDLGPRQYHACDYRNLAGATRLAA
ncbi:HAD family hydrolase [Pseudooceanicola sp. LIPI14-2-Ac024]|uniref:HAD family hydrolase n=1 Tax=Pseudooceanicola sp. LIPI14-2-Ac024 TaxID=3344875 RepID=UPI0035CEAE69